MNIEFLLLSTAGSVGLTLIFFAVKLRKAGLLRWTSSGFWALASFALYFVASPAACALSGQLHVYAASLTFVGGTGRGFFILLVTVIGICTFFITYLRTPYKPVYWKLASREQVFNVNTKLILGGFVLLGTWSLLAFKARVIGYSGERVIEGSRFVGSVTGYESNAYLFLILPLFLLLLSKDRLIQKIGWILSLGFLILTAAAASDRFVVVSFVLGISIVNCVFRGRTLPKATHVLVILLLAALLQVRGHSKWGSQHEFSTSTQELWSKPLTVLTKPDVSMLPTWYVESQLCDNYRGYDYGLNTLNYVLSGWIPFKYFPEKYFIIDWFEKQRGSYDIDSYRSILFGSKPSLLGSFYEHGGIVAVILCMALSGFLCRRLDGMLSSTSPELVRALGGAIMCQLWMIWGSHDYWAINSAGAIAIPAVFVWLVSRKARRRRWRIVAVNSEQKKVKVQTTSDPPPKLGFPLNPLPSAPLR
jgi:oligosaccharide repeat unit polymerase